MPGGMNIAMHGAGDENVNSPNVAVHFPFFRYADRSAGILAADKERN